ncbi:MAG TPA: ABC transporter permease [Gammaproteobacteria bacterium]|nr:ABC transporter permease [Gammaproteobacteria bacterium]
MWQDLRFSLRLIAKEPWFAAAVVVTLALGMGVNAIGFAVDSALLRGPAFPEAGRLYTIAWQSRFGLQDEASYPDLRDLREQSREFAALAGYREAGIDISGDASSPERVAGAFVTANTFDVLQQRPLLGRTFAPGEDEAGADPVVVIGSSLWQSRYGGDPSVIGKTLRVDAKPATIVGVMPPRMGFPENAQIWAPLAPNAALESRSARVVSVFGRLAAGADERTAASEVAAIGGRLAAAYPGDYGDNSALRVESFAESFAGGEAATMFAAVMAAAVIVLAISCFNVANLMLARATHRAREAAVRAAVGASRWRVVRQLLVEGVPLAGMGAAAGLLVAQVGVRVFDDALQTSGAPAWLEFAVDGRVLVYVAIFMVGSVLLFGLVPALRATEGNGNEVLKAGAPSRGGGPRGSRLASALVIAQLALTVTLLAGAGLLGRSLLALYGLDTGLEVDRLMASRIELPEARYGTAEQRAAFLEQLDERLAATPNAERHAVTTGVPPADGGERRAEAERTGDSAGASPRLVSTVTISPEFFDVVERPILRGRGFDAADGAPGVASVIVNERFAAMFFPGQEALGRRIRVSQAMVPAAGDKFVLFRPGQQDDEWRTIVGISASIPHGSVRESYASPVVYLPYRQESPAAVSLLIRSDAPPESVAATLRAAVQALDGDLPIAGVQTVEQLLAADRWPYRVFGALFGLLASIATVLSCVGLYAVMAYSVAQRTHEIGVRMAIGAHGRQVSWLVLRRALLQVGIGLPLGLAGAVVLGLVLRRILIVPPADPATLTGISVLLATVALAACALPARRATRVDPLAALRAD